MDNNPLITILGMLVALLAIALSLGSLAAAVYLVLKLAALIVPGLAKYANYQVALYLTAIVVLIKLIFK